MKGDADDYLSLQKLQKPLYAERGVFQELRYNKKYTVVSTVKGGWALHGGG
jgi:hypothetical protein